uniref:ATP synthase complex subunit 8 n=1 Tax=Paralimna concors TaxID=2818145 RepID=A0A8A2H8D1_9MUSC|nr:ATP synthase F0 subunit 8 [Paralimna concors]QSV37201.1 ATP synthase F0 subunit 8 [Paralimna concors]
MPQMAPMGWLSLFLIFFFTFLLFNMMNYFSFMPVSSQSNKFSYKSNSFNWKW